MMSVLSYTCIYISALIVDQSKDSSVLVHQFLASDLIDILLEDRPGSSFIQASIYTVEIEDDS